MAARSSTPPPRLTAPAPKPLTPEQVRRTEEARLRAKALRAQRDAELARSSNPAAGRTPSGFIVAPVAGQKRSLSSAQGGPASVRDGRQGSVAAGAAVGAAPQIQAARKFANYIDYDFSKMTDTKGGFLTADDDPHNKALHASTDTNGEARPAHMTAKEWERLQLMRKLRAQRAGPFEPGISALSAEDEKTKGCRECQSLEIDWTWAEVFDCRVCARCKEQLPDKYSLLTKTEAKEDYLLTDPELRDEELLPRLERPNPHKREWNNMHLFLRYQVEEYAFSERKWGTPERLDEEFARRTAEKKQRKEDKFRSKLADLKKRTRVEAHRRAREMHGIGGGGGAGAGEEARFGERIVNRGDKHEHEWGRTVTDRDGVGRKMCIECGMQVEELEF